jgi:hypothetical protein
MLIYGIDFSGARDAGEGIWVASGKTRLGRLRIDYLAAARDLPGSSPARQESLRCITFLIAGSGACKAGLDFPFSLPSEMIGEDWAGWALSLGRRFADAESFRDWCRQTAGGQEKLRRTDIETGAPMCAWNLRVYRQTYFGIRDVLAPLVRSDLARVVPMQEPDRRKPQLYEVCPASTLKAAGLYISYKETGPADRVSRREARRVILEWLEKSCRVRFAAPELRRRALDDGAGNALDAVLCAFAAARAWPRLSADPVERVEGRVYF